MSDCTIADKWGYWTAPGVFTGISGVQIYAVPDLNTRRYSVAGTYRNLGVNPNISSEAFKYGRTATTSGTGDYSFALPQSSSSRPAAPTPQWSIVLPDGRVLSGEVPNVAGPLTLDDLEVSYSWIWSSSVYVAPLTPGTLARGRATLTATDTAVILFGTSFAANNYKITLTPSLDSVTSQIPSVAYTANSVTGFTIKASGIVTCTVDWEAVL